MKKRAASVIHGFWHTDRSLTVLLALLILIIFVIQPLGDVGIGGRLLISSSFSLLLVSGVAAVAKNTLTKHLVAGLVVTTLIVRWLRVLIGGTGSLGVSDAFVSGLFCFILAAVVLAQVFREGEITADRIQGAVAVYLLLGLAWAFAYELIELRWPGAFMGSAIDNAGQYDDATSRFVYFSFITLTTAGYGDITPVHPAARSLVTLETLTGQLFPAILLARLVSMELFDRQSKRTGRSD